MFSPSESVWVAAVAYGCVLAAVLVMYIVGWRESKAEKALLKSTVLPGGQDLILQRSFWSYFAFKNAPLFGGLSLLPFLNLMIAGNDDFPVNGGVALPMAVMFGWFWARSRHARPCLRLNASGLHLTSVGAASPLFIEWRDIEAVRIDQFNGEAAVFFFYKTRKPIRLQPSDYGCPPAFLFAALKAHHAAAPFVETELLVREAEERQYIC